MIKKLSHDIFIYGFTNAIKSLVPFIMLPILTLYLSVEEFGILSLIEVSILFLFPIVSLNIHSGVNVEYFYLTKEKLALYITNGLLLSMFSFIVILLIIILFSTQGEPYVNVPWIILFLLPLFAILRLLPQLLLGLFQVEQKSKSYLLFTIIQTLIDFSLSYILVMSYKNGYLGRLEGIYISAFLMSCFSFYYLYRYDFLGSLTLQYTKRILIFALPLIVHVLGGVIIAMSDRYFIAYYRDNETLAYYTVAYQIAALMLLFSTAINQAWSPFLYRLLKDENKFFYVLKYTILLILIFILFGTLIYFLKDTIFSLFVNEKFYAAKEYFLYLLIGFVFQSLYFLVTNFLFFKKNTKILAKITFSGAILNLILNYLLLHKYGVIGVAYATGITWAIFFIAVSWVVIYTYKKEEYFDKNNTL